MLQEDGSWNEVAKSRKYGITVFSKKYDVWNFPRNFSLFQYSPIVVYKVKTRFRAPLKKAYDQISMEISRNFLILRSYLGECKI
jgi:hypothetical protein